MNDEVLLQMSEALEEAITDDISVVPSDSLVAAIVLRICNCWDELSNEEFLKILHEEGLPEADEDSVTVLLSDVQSAFENLEFEEVSC